MHTWTSTHTIVCTVSTGWFTVILSLCYILISSFLFVTTAFPSEASVSVKIDMPPQPGWTSQSSEHPLCYTPPPLPVHTKIHQHLFDSTDVATCTLSLSLSLSLNMLSLYRCITCSPSLSLSTGTYMSHTVRIPDSAGHSGWIYLIYIY